MSTIEHFVSWEEAHEGPRGCGCGVLLGSCADTFDPIYIDETLSSGSMTSSLEGSSFNGSREFMFEVINKKHSEETMATRQEFISKKGSHDTFATRQESTETEEEKPTIISQLVREKALIALPITDLPTHLTAVFARKIWGQTTNKVQTEEAQLNCDYDKDVTIIYQALEEKAWIAAWERLESRKPAIQDEVRTWVSRYDKDGNLRWKMLPLHAAMVFGAPFKIVKSLMGVYPFALQCTDDQNNLPLHLAFRHGAPENIIWCLLKAFPKGILAKDSQGREPLECAKRSPNLSLQNIVQKYIARTFKLCKRTFPPKFDISSKPQVKALQAAIDTEKTMAMELEKNTQVLTQTNREKQEHHARMQDEAEQLKKKIREWLAQEEVEVKAQEALLTQEEAEVKAHEALLTDTGTASKKKLDQLNKKKAKVQTRKDELQQKKDAMFDQEVLLAKIEGPELPVKEGTDYVYC